MRIQVIADFAKVSHPKKAWQSFLPEDKKRTDYLSQISPIQYAKATLNPSTSEGFVAGIGAIESSFLTQVAKLDIPYGHSDEAPLLVAIEYLTALEGPFWVKIRGLGLAYNYSIDSSFESGRLTFILAKSSNVIQAYEVAKQIVDDIVSKKTPIEDTALEGSKSASMFTILSKEENYEMAALQSLVKYIKNVGPNGNKQLLLEIQRVKKEDVIRVLDSYIRGLFDTKNTRTVITTNPSKVDEITRGFEKMGRKLSDVKIDSFF